MINAKFLPATKRSSRMPGTVPASLRTASERAYRPAPTMNDAPSSVDHDVRRGRRVAVFVGLAGLGVVPPPTLLAPHDLVQEPDREEEDPDAEPEPAQRDVPRVVEQAQERREEGEDARRKDDEGADEEAREAPLALARHLSGNGRGQF